MIREWFLLHQKEFSFAKYFGQRAVMILFVVGALIFLSYLEIFAASDFQYLRGWKLSEPQTAMIVPSNLVTDKIGNVYLSDPSCQCIKKFSSKGKLLKKFGTYKGPAGIDLDSLNHIFVVDSYNARILKFSPEGQLIKSWGSQGMNDGQFNLPAGLTIDESNNVWIADKGNHRVQKFTSDGTFLLKFGAKGNSKGQFNVPIDVASDKDGNIYVVDTGNNRIQKFDKFGRFLASWQVPNVPISIAIDERKSRVYVGGMDSYIYQFTTDGKVVGKFWCRGPLPGRSQKIAYEGMPQGLTVNNDGEILVLDLMNFRVMVFGMP